MQQPRRLFREQSKTDFRSVGAIAPSSRWLAAALTAGLAANRGAAAEHRSLLEVGAGTGAVTTAIAAALGHQDTLLVVEQNAAFAAHLEARLADDTAFRSVQDRVHILHASVSTLEPVSRFHVIVSSLPFNNFTPEEVAGYLRLFRSLLLPGGEIRFYEYLAIRRLRAAFSSASERRRLTGVGRVLTAALASGTSQSRVVWCNLPPAVMHVLRP
jgi:phosphatidylethanolamine/phosphatidyl-N-methylethanolamine N-methyltransferase